MKHALSEASLPHGFRFAATACGLKKTGALDLALLCSEVPASAAAVFTQNLVVAAPVLISKQNLRNFQGPHARRRGQRRQCQLRNRHRRPRRRATHRRRSGQAPGLPAARTFCLLHRRHRRAAAARQNIARAAADHAPSAPFGALFCGAIAGDLHHRHAPKNRFGFLQNGRQARPFRRLRQGRGHDSPQHGHHAGFCRHRCRHRARAAAENSARCDVAHLQRHFHRWRYFHQRHLAGARQRRGRAPAH